MHNVGYLLCWPLLASVWCFSAVGSAVGDGVRARGAVNYTVIQWYRTAQNTTDRLTKQADVQFGADFPSDAVIYINR